MAKSLNVETANSSTPTMMIQAGWNLVCDAFIKRFGAYPSDEEIMKSAPVIGGQNVEFVQMFRGIYEAAIKHSASIEREFAANFLVRAPALAERIQGGARVDFPTDAKFHSMMVSAESIVSGIEPTPIKSARDPWSATPTELSLSNAQKQKLLKIAEDEDWAGAWDSIAVELEWYGLVQKMTGPNGQELATPTTKGFEMARSLRQDGQPPAQSS